MLGLGLLAADEASRRLLGPLGGFSWFYGAGSVTVVCASALALLIGYRLSDLFRRRTAAGLLASGAFAFALVQISQQIPQMVGRIWPFPRFTRMPSTPGAPALTLDEPQLRSFIEANSAYVAVQGLLVVALFAAAAVAVEIVARVIEKRRAASGPGHGVRAGAEAA